MYIHPAERRQALPNDSRPRRLRASNLSVLSAPLPTSDPSGVQRRRPEGRKYYPSDRQAVAAPSALLPAKRSGATCVWSSPFFKLPKPDREDQDAEEAEGVQDEDSRLLWRAAGQANADKSKQISRRARPERRKVLTALVNQEH